MLDRLSFGVSPAEVDRSAAMGWNAWLDRQLHPERIDDRAVEARLPALADPPADQDPQALRQFARQQVEVLAGQKVLRALYSERQLQEILTDFWFNHFNVNAAKGRTAVFLPAYERDAIRPYVFGRFRDLLGATAHSPAMLFYLDNWLSADPSAADRMPLRRRQAGAAPRRGLNENYGRELMELHTLGVDGGYTQHDVVEVARAFTGWTIDRDGRFRFVQALHDPGRKEVLGHTIAAGGERDGDAVLDLLAQQPATARHVAFELTQRLVDDVPPPALVDRAAARFRQTDGDLREVVRTIVTAPEFVEAATRHQKLKSPLEFVVSAVRASGATVSEAQPIVRALQLLGEPLYLCVPPTGYAATEDAWLSAGALVTRLNFATRLSTGTLPGVSLPPDAPAPRELARVLGSPAFQRH